MLFLRYLLLITGFALFAGAAGILIYDLYVILKGRKPESHGETLPELPERAPAMASRATSFRGAFGGAIPGVGAPLSRWPWQGPFRFFWA
jgi:hypothetical protein